MTDVHSPDVRSFNMKQILNKDTKPELIVRRFLFSSGLRYRLHDNKLPGKPDLVFHKHKKVVFVNGCYWHGHENCKYFSPPKTRTEWWTNKIYKTKERDRVKAQLLVAMGWSVIIVWECELKSGKKDETLRALLERIKG